MCKLVLNPTELLVTMMSFGRVILVNYAVYKTLLIVLLKVLSVLILLPFNLIESPLVFVL